MKDLAIVKLCMVNFSAKTLNVPLCCANKHMYVSYMQMEHVATNNYSS